MHLIVGLGNPGEEYADTRHNAGFRTVDLLGEELGARYWKSECGSLCAHVTADDRDIILAKPQSFMNCSGGPVSQLLRAYDVPADHLIVIHDELDIPAGSIRVKFGGGHAGHNGLRSLCDKTQTRDWYRVRVGIGRPPGRMDVADYVLRSPRGEEAEALAVAEARAAEAVRFLLDNGLAKTQERFN